MIHLKNISSASVRCVCIISVLYCAYLCIKFSLGISDFLEVISSLSHCILFLYLFVLFTRKEFFFSVFFYFIIIIILLYNILSLLSFDILLLFSQLFVRLSQTTILLFCISFVGMALDHQLLYNVMNLHQ